MDDRRQVMAMWAKKSASKLGEKLNILFISQICKILEFVSLFEIKCPDCFMVHLWLYLFHMIEVPTGTKLCIIKVLYVYKRISRNKSL